MGGCRLRWLVLTPPDLAERLTAAAGAVSDANWVETPRGAFHLPAPRTYRSFFAWDSGWHVLGLGLARPERALRELQTVFAFQLENGAVPHEVRIAELLTDEAVVRRVGRRLVSRQYDDAGRSRLIDPPSYLLAAGALWRRTGDRRILDLVPSMRRVLDHLIGARDLNGDGLVAIVHPWEAGTDAAPVFDEAMGLRRWRGRIAHSVANWRILRRLDERGWDLAAAAADDRFVVEDLAVNGLAAAGALAVADLCDAAGDGAGAASCRHTAERLIESANRHLWDDDLGFYHPRFGHRSPRRSPRTCASGLTPLLSGLVEPARARRVIATHVEAVEHFAAPWPIAFNSRREIAHDGARFRNQALWRGPCVWICMNWVAARAAAVAGREDVARRITEATATLIDRSGFAEFYDPESGTPGGALGFTWSALVLDMIAEHGLR